MKNISALPIIFFMLLAFSLRAQVKDTLDVDKSFSRARTLAFSGKKAEAKVLCKRILNKSPHYADVKVLLGRIYAWSDQYDSARITLKEVIRNKPYEDAYIALTDLERWDSKNTTAIAFADEGLHYFPNSKELHLKKAQALNNDDHSEEAYKVLDSLLGKNPDYTEARSLAESIKVNGFTNKLGVSYDLDHFDKRYTDNWQLTAISYSRKIKGFGSVIARINIADRFKTRGYQYEIDAYPHLGDKMYAYINAGYSVSSIFPDKRAGVSVYRSLPKAFEAELGIRYLYFSKAVFLYTGSVGKYYKNFWFSFRPTLIKTDSAFLFSRSYSFIVRYYFKTADDYIGLTVGKGVSPDERSKQNLFENPSLQSSKIRLSYQQKFFHRFIFSLSGGILNEEFSIGPTSVSRGNDYSFSSGIEMKF